MKASYLKLLKSGELEKRTDLALSMLQECRMCPHECGADRTSGEKGFCKIAARAMVSTWGAHFGEEPPISGSQGSGTVFFSGCNMRCIYCQNFEVSQGLEGYEVTGELLAFFFLSLQEQGCHNINLVTPSHVVPQILEGLLIAAKEGLEIPVVYNSGGYDKVSTLGLLDGIIDIYMPDMKYSDSATGLELSKVKNYWQVCRDAIKEMFRQVGNLRTDRSGVAERGLLIRHLVLPGDLIIGADSHTCTYGALGAFATGVGSTDLAAAMATGKVWFKVPESIKLVYHGTPGPWVEGKDLILYTIGRLGVDGALYQSMEMQGEAIEKLPMYGRFTMANMAIEAGAKNGIITPDEITLDYVRERSTRDCHLFFSDPGAEYVYEMDIDVSRIKPQVAFPSLPENSREVAAAVEQGITLDQVVIGSCTNGRIEDLRLAAKVLRGKKVAPYLRLIVIPGTQAIYLQAVREGLAEIFVEAGAVFSTPTCGPCLGGHMGILAAGEKALATTNRNFVGRMGHPESEVYLSNPAVAAASAVLGRIASPEEVLS